MHFGPRFQKKKSVLQNGGVLCWENNQREAESGCIPVPVCVYYSETTITFKKKNNQPTCRVIYL